MPDLDNQIPGGETATDVISSKVFIGTTELSNEIGLMSITVNKTFNKIAYAKMTFLDGSVADRDFPHSNDDQFKPGNTIKVQLGYHGQVETVFEGIIVKHGIRARENSSSVLLIEAKDEAIKLTGARKSAYHLNKTDSDVIADLAGSLQKDIDSTTITHKQLVQFNCTNWDFIVTRAEANGMLVFTDDGKLIVKKPTTTDPSSCTLTYGDNIQEFEAETDSRLLNKTITSQSWDYTKQELEVSSEGTSSFSTTGNFAPDALEKVLESKVLLTHSGHLTVDQLNEWSNAYELKNKLSQAVGRVRITGRTDIKPGAMIELAGVGNRFNGNVFVTGILHQYDGIWQTDIQFGWREDWFYKKDDVMDKPGSGLLPGINGLQIGVVLNVDDTEDGGQFRVQVHNPLINATNEGVWARVATLDAGKNRGVFFRPQKDDEVVLGFLNDDPREPVILGYLHSKDKLPSPLPEEDGALQYGIVTKEGNKLVFDDTNKSIKLRIQAGQGEKTLFMDGKSGSFELKDENSNSIKLDSSGVTIEAGSGMNVIIKGTQVLIN